MTRGFSLVLTLVAANALAGGTSAVLTDYGQAAQESARTTPSTPAVAVETNGSSKVRDARRKGTSWLEEHQHRDGGWSSGAHGTDGSAAGSDVATTAFAVLALQRDEAGSRAHHAAITKGVDFVIRAVQTAPEGPRLNTPEGTQIQYKMGPLVDTHMATLMLSEVLHRLDGDRKTRAKSALERAVRKVERSQNADGSFDANGWAPVLSSSIAAQGLNNVVALGYVDVDEQVLRRSDRYQSGQVDAASGSFDTSAGAGVQLYAVASTIKGNADVSKRRGRNAPTAAAREKAMEAEQSATRAVAQDTSGALLAGFGSIGGEEMVSYMMISDTLAEKGGKDWQKWDRKVGDFLVNAQNQDGSWTGHHCITSQAFTTAGGIMTLAAGDAANEARSRM
ncbi:MAG: terpene cyclase/mutase family protein [Myxococcales bacterium]|nr:terpene cyclase/mutase family protein [Myxococcales bacterium]